MVNFLRLDEAVVDPLPLSETTQFRDDAVAFVRQRHHLSRRFVRAENRFLLD